jgi:hypothetical protein
MKVIIETIPHQEHRYTTVGDWYYDPDGTLRIKVSQLSDWRYEALIAIHELVEVMLCDHAGVTETVVDKFDKEFEANREPDNEDEPGDEPDAPYVHQHCVATGIERILAAEMGVNWKPYEDELCELPEVEPKDGKDKL